MQFPSLNFSIIDFFIVKISYVTITLGEGGVGVSPKLINVINFTAFFLKSSLTSNLGKKTIKQKENSAPYDLGLTKGIFMEDHTP